jgi:hypothetical protein
MRKRLPILGAAALLLSACGAGSIPTPEESSGMLDQLIAFAKAGDFDGLCSIGDLNCQDALKEVGLESAPTERPIVLGTRVVDANPAIGATGGRVLELCGIDGLGRTFNSEILVFRDGGTLRVINPVFWSGISIASGETTLESPPPAQSCP